MTESDRAVHALVVELGITHGCVPVQTNLRMTLAKSSQSRQQPALQKRRQHRHMQEAFWFFSLRTLHTLRRLADVAQSLAHLIAVNPPCIRQRQASSLARYQLDTQMALQRADLVTHRAMRQVQGLCRRLNRSVLNQGGKCTQGGQLTVRPFAAYREMVLARTSPAAKGSPRKEEILMIDKLSDTMAVAKVRLRLFDHIMEDHLNLMKHEGQWMIYAKHFTQAGVAS